MSLTGDKSATLGVNCGMSTGRNGVVQALTSSDYKQPQTVAKAVDCRNGTVQHINGTLQAKESGGTSLNLNNVVLENTGCSQSLNVERERERAVPQILGTLVSRYGSTGNTQDGLMIAVRLPTELDKRSAIKSENPRTRSELK